MLEHDTNVNKSDSNIENCMEIFNNFLNSFQKINIDKEKE
jgi:hypothetical protein